MNNTYQLAEKEGQNKTQRSNGGGISSPSRTIIHAKLEMGQAEDRDEIEADIAANDVVNNGVLRRKISAGHESSGIEISSQMEGTLNSLAGGGHIMPNGLRNIMEHGFNHDFSHVKLHTDNSAAELSENIHAKAFTLGNDIYFNRGQFNPHSSDGQKLVAHELAHVVQRSSKIKRQASEEKPKTESIAVVGTQYKDDFNKTSFINEGIRYLLNQKGVTEKTMIVFDYEYSEELMNGLESVLEEKNIRLRKIKEIKNLIDYINGGDNSLSRKRYKIKGIGIFSHGVYEKNEQNEQNKQNEQEYQSKFSFGYHINGEGSLTEKALQFGNEDAKRLSKDAFAEDALIKSYACQTARDMKLAQQLANSSGAEVIATANKTDYSDSAGNIRDRICSESLRVNPPVKVKEILKKGFTPGLSSEQKCNFYKSTSYPEWRPIISESFFFDGYPIFPNGSPRDVKLGSQMDKDLNGWSRFFPTFDPEIIQANDEDGSM